MGRYPAAPGLLITTGCSCLFITLAIGVATGGPLVRFDRSMAEFLHTYASEASGLTDFIRVVSFLGSLEVLALVGVLVASTLLRAPTGGRDLLQLYQRTGDGIPSGVRDARLLWHH
jgi:hypothetical protein